MTTAVIGATGRVGSEIVRGLIERGDAVAALVRDADKARRVFGEAEALHIRPTRVPTDYWPPAAPSGGVPSRLPRGIRLMPARHLASALESPRHPYHSIDDTNV
jgi:NAD(P)-dependent dehydrogenase (short-subunit alcohol dehydrogenase family)